jgi:CHAD domain-containing protein
MDMERGTPRTAASAAVVAGGAIVAGKVVRDRVTERAERKRARRYRIEPGETVDDGIGRIAEGQLELAIALIDGREGDGPEATHEARKALKRLRATLRLCRSWLGAERFRQENTILRDGGRALSGARDAQVLLETLDGVGRPGGDAWPRFREALAQDARAHRDGGGADHANVVTALVGVRERVAVWPLPEAEGPEVLADGLRRVYSKARRAWRAAERKPTDERLHELRKRSKDVWHCGQLLSDVGSKRVRKLRRRAHRLADVLGEDHDLAVLVERAEASPELFGEGELSALTELVKRRRRVLQRDALARAAELYRRKPRKLAGKLAAA